MLRDQVTVALSGLTGLSIGTFNVTVQQGLVQVWGVADSDDEERAVLVAVENIAGVSRVEMHLGRIPAWADGI